jgi:hypothetical protein
MAPAWGRMQRSSANANARRDTYLESAPNEPFDTFAKRVVAVAAALGDRFLWLRNHRLSRNQASA